MANEQLKNVIVIKTESGRVWKVDRVANSLTLYADETKYNANDSIGTLNIAELKSVAIEGGFFK